MSKGYGSSRNSKRKRANSSNLAALLIFALSFLIIGGLGYIYITTKNQYDEINSKTFCRKDKPTAITAILIDHTDNINPTQKAALEVRLWEVAQSIPKNSMIKVYSVRDTSKKILAPDIELCNPGNGKDSNNITGNTDLANKRYEDKFKKPISEILDRVVSASTSQQSPIMESVQSVAITSFVGEERGVAKKKLILVSDLLEHTEKFSLYNKDIPDFAVYKESSHWRFVKADLKNVDVEIYMLRRDGQDLLQNNKLIGFWTEFFVNQGAHITHTLPIEG